jgi:GH18 family chitinase
LFKNLVTLRSGRTKLILSVGGPSHDDEVFSRMVTNATARKNFVHNSTEYLKKMNFDGMNIYWNAPVCTFLMITPKNTQLFLFSV